MTYVQTGGQADLLGLISACPPIWTYVIKGPNTLCLSLNDPSCVSGDKANPFPKEIPDPVLCAVPLPAHRADCVFSL